MRPFATLHLVQIGSDVLGLDMTERNTFARYLKVGAATKDAPGFVGGRDAFINLLQQGFQRGAMGVLGCISIGNVLFNLGEINGNGGCSFRHGDSYGLSFSLYAQRTLFISILMTPQFVDKPS
jgi:hypothetical protein